MPLEVALHYGDEVKSFYGGGMIDNLIQPGLGGLGAILVAPDALGGGDWTTRAKDSCGIVLFPFPYLVRSARM